MISLRILYLSLLLLVNVQSFAQTLVVKGRILSNEKKSMPFVNIYFKGTSVGTISNEQGEFELSFPQNKFDTIVVSHIAYKQQLIAVDNISSGQSIEIVLEEDVLTLSEVTIKSPKLIKSAKEIVNKAINQIRITSSNRDHILKGYYRHLNEQDGEYRQLIEAAITVFESGLGGQEPKFNVDEIRRSNDLRVDYNLKGSNTNKSDHATLENLQAQDMNRKSLTLNCWYKNNFQRQSSKNINEYGINSCGGYDFGVLNEDFLKEHKFKLDTITAFEDEYVYVVKILPSSASKSYYTFPDNLIIPIGKLYIRTDDFAVLKMEYQYILNPRKKSSDDFKTTYRVFGSGIIFQTTALYKEFEGSMYLSFLHTKNYYATSVADRKNRTSQTGRIYNLVDRILLVNEIIVDQEFVKTTLGTKLWDDQLFKESHVYNETFWHKYNTIVETKNEEKMRKDLEKKSTLEEQFKKNK